MKENKSMTILHVCGVENKMSNGATVAVLNHVNEQAKTGLADIWALHINDVQLNWNELVHSVLMDDYEDAVSHVDLIVFHEIYYMPFFKMASYATKVGKPYVVIPHGGLTAGAQSQRKYAKIIVNAIWAKRYIKQAAGVQFLSEKERSAAVRWNDNSFIAPNGVRVTESCKYSQTNCNSSETDSSKDNPNKENLRSPSDESDGMKLIFIGRINLFYKGLDALVDAVEIIADKMRDKSISIDIYGPKEGDDRSQLEGMVSEKSLGDLIRIHDGVFGRDKDQVMIGADAFIQPSRSEGMPMGILDAMAIGLPVIVAPGTSFDKAVLDNDCGWVCQSEAESIAQTIMQAYQERYLLETKSHNARSFVADNYEWSKVARETLDKYQEIANK